MNSVSKIPDSVPEVGKIMNSVSKIPDSVPKVGKIMNSVSKIPDSVIEVGRIHNSAPEIHRIRKSVPNFGKNPDVVTGYPQLVSFLSLCT